MNGFSSLPKPRFRWRIGLLLPGLARRLIPRNFGEILPSRADQAFSNPVRQADAYRVSRFSNQRVVLRHQPNPERGGMCP